MYYINISKITDLSLDGYPSEYPMFFMATEEELDKYSKLMFKAISLGFGAEIRKLCFTLKCTEGFTHKDIFDKTKDMYQVTEDEYNMFLQIPHWNPITAAIRVLEGFIELTSSMEKALDNDELRSHIEEAISKVNESAMES